MTDRRTGWWHSTRPIPFLSRTDWRTLTLMNDHRWQFIPRICWEQIIIRTGTWQEGRLDGNRWTDWRPRSKLVNRLTLFSVLNSFEEFIYCVLYFWFNHQQNEISVDLIYIHNLFSWQLWVASYYIDGLAGSIKPNSMLMQSCWADIENKSAIGWLAMKLSYCAA